MNSAAASRRLASRDEKKQAAHLDNGGRSDHLGLALFLASSIVVIKQADSRDKLSRRMNDGRGKEDKEIESHSFP